MDQPPLSDWRRGRRAYSRSPAAGLVRRGEPGEEADGLGVLVRVGGHVPRVEGRPGRTGVPALRCRRVESQVITGAQIRPRPPHSRIRTRSPCVRFKSCFPFRFRRLNHFFSVFRRRFTARFCRRRILCSLGWSGAAPVCAAAGASPNGTSKLAARAPRTTRLRIRRPFQPHRWKGRNRPIMGQATMALG
jgi:hypothetical protein